MRRIAILAAMGTSLCLGSLAGAQEIETFDSPNQTQTNHGNFKFDPPIQGSWSNNGTITDNPTSITINTFPGPGGNYGTAYHNFYTDDTPKSIDISGSNALQLDVTIPVGDAGLFVDLVDGEGDFVQYKYGYGLVGSGNAPPQIPGETIKELGNNELILDVPLATTATFDFTQVTLFRLEDDPGTSSTNSISYNDLSAVTVPEPASLGLSALACVFFGRRRRH